MTSPRKILLLYADPHYLVQQVHPFGLDVIANRLRAEGHEAVLACPFLPDPDVAANVAACLEEIEPDVIGLGIRNIDTCMSREPCGDFVRGPVRTFLDRKSVV